MMQVFYPLLVCWFAVSCVQTTQDLSTVDRPMSSNSRTSASKVFSKGDVSNQKINLVYNSQHKPINSLRYITFTIISEDIQSVQIQGSSNKNVSNVNHQEQSIRHLVHPFDQILHVNITKVDGSVESTSYSIDVDEVIL